MAIGESKRISWNMRLITFIETFFARPVIYKELECSFSIAFYDCSAFFSKATSADTKNMLARRGGMEWKATKNCRNFGARKKTTWRIHKFVKLFMAFNLLAGCLGFLGCWGGMGRDDCDVTSSATERDLLGWTSNATWVLLQSLHRHGYTATWLNTESTASCWVTGATNRHVGTVGQQHGQVWVKEDFYVANQNDSLQVSADSLIQHLWLLATSLSFNIRQLECLKVSSNVIK